MLKLNSSYARSHLRDTNKLDDEIKMRDTINYKMKQQINVERNDLQSYPYRRQSYKNKEQIPIQCYNEPTKQHHYVEQLYSPSIISRKHLNYSYKNQNQDISLHSTQSAQFGQQLQRGQYRKNDSMIHQPKSQLKNDHRPINMDFKPNHSKRNDSIKNDFLRSDTSEEYQTKRSHYNNNRLNQDDEDKVYRNYKKKDIDIDQLENRQFYNKYLCQKPKSSKQELEMDQFYSNNSLNQRKTDIKKKMVQNTPQKRTTMMYEPGSQEKKRSLIEKSQILQEKLRKLNIQKSTPSVQPLKYSQQQRVSLFVNEFKQSQYQTQKQNNRASMKSQVYSPSNSTFNKYNLNTRSPNYQASHLPLNNYQNRYINYAAHNTKGNRTGDAIQKITQLNEKINERIQSIISNYTKN